MRALVREADREKQKRASNLLPIGLGIRALIKGEPDGAA